MVTGPTMDTANKSRMPVVGTFTVITVAAIKELTNSTVGLRITVRPGMTEITEIIKGLLLREDAWTKTTEEEAEGLT